MLTSIVALILRIVSNPCANLFQKKLSETESSISVNLYSSLFMAIFALPLLFFVGFSYINLEFIFYVLLSGMLCFLGTICLIKALSIGEMSVLGPINSYKSVIGLLFAFILLGEIPTTKALFGFLLIVLASFLFLDEKGQFILNKSVFLRFLALFFTGIEAVIIKKIILLSSPLVAFIYWCFCGLIFSLIFGLLFKKTKLNNKKSLNGCFLIAILLFIMQISTNYVFDNVPVGLSLSLFQLSSVVSLFFGFRYFKEGGIIKKTIGTIIMIIGSTLILLK